MRASQTLTRQSVLRICLTSGYKVVGDGTEYDLLIDAPNAISAAQRIQSMLTTPAGETVIALAPRTALPSPPHAKGALDAPISQTDPTEEMQHGS